MGTSIQRFRSARIPQLDLRAFSRLALIAFAIREPFSGLVQYELQTLNLSPAWFVVDLASTCCLILLAVEDLFMNRAVYLLLLVFLASEMFLGYVVSESVFAVAAGLKAILPIFVGVLIGRETIRSPRMIALFYGLLVLCCLGVVISLNYDLPWANLSADSGFGTKQVARLQWATGGGVRGFGFASDAHSCAVGIIFLWVVLGFGHRSNVYYAVGLMAAFAIYLTSSKTSFVCFSLFFIFRFALDRLPTDMRGAFVISAQVIPYLAVLMPLAVIAFSTLVPRDELPSAFAGLWDRGGVVYLEPFTFMAEFFSPAWITGFGLGGIGFPLVRSDYVRYSVTIDNFNLFGYYTFGILYIIGGLFIVRWAASQSDLDRRIVFGVLMLFGQFITFWPTPLLMILLGYSLSGLLRPPETRSEVRLSRTSRGSEWGLATPSSAPRSSRTPF